MAKLKIKKGDMVKVISGDDKGKQGRILSVDLKKMRAFVEGVSIVSKHTKPNAKNTQGGIVKQEGSVHVSNLMVIDGSGKATRVGRRADEKTGKLVRYSKNTDEVLK